MSFHNEPEDETVKDAGMLLNLSQKSGIFVADQTPTPTRLIKNCEEVGLFEDLQNVNPFDETFRRACEQNVQLTPKSQQQFQVDENSLHTPQIFPQFDAAVESGVVASEDLSKQTLDTPIELDVGSVENILDASKAESFEPAGTKYRSIAEKSTTNNVSTTQAGLTILPSCIQFMQPQVITVTFPTMENLNNTASTQREYLEIKANKSPIKTQLLLPKLSTTNITPTKDTIVSSTTSTQLTSQPEPSSASLTPTSQLPIKERLKAILSQSNRARPADWSDKSCGAQNFRKNKSYKSSRDETIERKRAASTRYRNKIRNEYKELQKRNIELQAENGKLKERIKQLELENSKFKTPSLQTAIASSNFSAQGIPSEIQIPASTIHLVMNIPKLMIPYGIPM